MSTILTSPKHTYPHTEVALYDNSAVTATTNAQVSNGTKMLFVLRSPRGIDGKIIDITGGATELLAKFGNGPISEYGQAIANAYAAVGTGYVNASIERICAKDAKRSNIYVYAAYKIVTAEGAVPKMSVRFLTAYDDALVSEDNLGSKAATLTPKVFKLDENGVATATVDDTYETVFLFAIGSKGRGSYGNNLAVQFASNDRRDRMNGFKNYTLSILEGNSTIESNSLCLYSGAIYNGASLSADTTINDPIDGSDNISIFTNDTAIPEIVNAYNTGVYKTLTNKQIYEYAVSLGLTNLVSVNSAVPDTDDSHYVVSSIRPLMELTEENFDAILGVNKNMVPKVTKHYLVNNTVPIYNYVIEDVALDSTNAPVNIIMNAAYGNALKGGTEGAFATTANGGTSTDTSAVKTAIDEAYRYAYNPSDITDSIKTEDQTAGYMRSADQTIYSKTVHPIELICDAGFAMEVKLAIANLCAQRGDCMAIFDVGVDPETKEDVLAVAMNIIAYCGSDFHYMVDAYYCKVYDPVSKKIVKVPSTYLLSSAYPTHFSLYGDKHVPFAGASYGQLTGFIAGTIFPVMDEDIDSVLMQNFYDYRINYAQINPKGIVTRGTQATTQEETTALSEANNVFIVLDIKRDCESICAGYAYNFFDAADIARFNRACDDLVAKYSAAQVQSIKGAFTSDDDDIDNGILHLTINLVHKKLVKIAMVDININRS